RRRHTRFSRDWSSDVCSSDLSTCTASTFWTAWQQAAARLPEGRCGAGGRLDQAPGWRGDRTRQPPFGSVAAETAQLLLQLALIRSEERRVGKQGRSRRTTDAQ